MPDKSALEDAKGWAELVTKALGPSWTRDPLLPEPTARSPRNPRAFRGGGFSTPTERAGSCVAVIVEGKDGFLALGDEFVERDVQIGAGRESPPGAHSSVPSYLAVISPEPVTLFVTSCGLPA